MRVVVRQGFYCTDLIHEGGCLVDEKLSLSRVKIVQNGTLTYVSDNTNNIFFLLFDLLQ